MLINRESERERSSTEHTSEKLGKLSILVHVFNRTTEEVKASISLVYSGQLEVHIKTLFHL